MQSLEPNTEKEDKILQNKKTIHFPDGLPAFESVKDFVLIANEEEHPFLWLQAVNTPNLAFVTIDPFLICPEYQPDLCDDDVSFLELDSPGDALVLSIVNIHQAEGQEITANLVGPLVVNVAKQVGKQVIIQNHLKYSVKFPVAGAQ